MRSYSRDRKGKHAVWPCPLLRDVAPVSLGQYNRAINNAQEPLLYTGSREGSQALRGR